MNADGGDKDAKFVRECRDKAGRQAHDCGFVVRMKAAGPVVTVVIYADIPRSKL